MRSQIDQELWDSYWRETESKRLGIQLFQNGAPTSPKRLWFQPIGYFTNSSCVHPSVSTVQRRLPACVHLTEIVTDIKREKSKQMSCCSLPILPCGLGAWPFDGRQGITTLKNTKQLSQSKYSITKGKKERTVGKTRFDGQSLPKAFAED